MNVPVTTTRHRPAAAPAAARGSMRKSEAAQIAQLFAAEHDREAEQQAALAAQQAQFNFDLAQRAELQRESNELRALAMTQQKLDDEIVKKWIELIA